MPLKSILLKYWGYSQFRPLQEEIIQSVVDKKDTLALMPTGGGKSLCFQIPGIHLPGVCLVVTPLIALMKDQVEQLNRRGIPAAALYSGMHSREIELMLNYAVHQKLKFLYISPERLKTDLFLGHLPQMQVNLIAVDEAHCISQWGYDFRPPYLEIAEIRRFHPKAPVLAVTATATPDVVKDIMEKLGFKSPNVFQKSFSRTNLTYFAFKEEDKLGRLIRILAKAKGSAVVYVRNRKKTREIADFLNKNGIRSTFYHAGLNQQDRDKAQLSWTKNQAQVVVATNAFGMGIDKPDVRAVVHLDLPDTPEAYFQEAGRAGRDEKQAYAVLLYNYSDIDNLRQNFSSSYPELAEIKRIYQMLGNHFQVPIGGGKDQAYDFDLRSFSELLSLSPITVYNALKILEKDGYLILNEDLNGPSKVFIHIGKENLYRFQVANPAYDSLLKTMLRSYGGMFADFVKISETEISKRIHIEETRIVKALQNLHKFDVLTYQESKKKPQIIFTSERMDAKDLRLTPESYDFLKNAARKRMEAIIEYVELDVKCRSQFLLAYFGEINSKRCGKCDICIERNKLELSQLEFDNVVNVLKPLLKQQNLTIKQLAKKLDEIPEENLVKVVRWLLENEKITENLNGELYWS